MTMDLKPNWGNFVILIIAGCWAFLVTFSPYMMEPGTIQFDDDMSGVGNQDRYEIIDNAELNPVVRRVYRSGVVMCHQMESRSFKLNGNQSPYCERCTAIFWGFALGALIVTFKRIELSAWWVVAGLIPMGIDGVTQLVGLRESNMALRILTGVPAGMITTMALGVIVFEIQDSIRYARLVKRARDRSIDPQILWMEEEGIEMSDERKRLYGIEQGKYQGKENQRGKARSSSDDISSSTAGKPADGAEGDRNANGRKK